MADTTGAGAALGVDLNRSFWEDDLEMHLSDTLEFATHSRAVQNWVGKLDHRAMSVLCACLGESGLDKLDEKRQFLNSHWADLRDYYLVKTFAHRKSKVAIQGVALTPGVLQPHVLELYEKCPEEYDTDALLFALYAASPEHLKLVFHLDKIHKSGFARMELAKPPRAPQHTFDSFARNENTIRAILDEHNLSRRDRRHCELKRVLDVGSGHTLIFIRRPDRSQHILPEQGQAAATKLVHGYRSEWIVLDFHDNARMVGISSVSNDVPLELANRIASVYFQMECEYENQRLATYPAQIFRLLNGLKTGNCANLGMILFQIRQSPFRGSPPVEFGPTDTESVVSAIGDLENNYGDLFGDIANVGKIKVEYQGKKVEIRFEQEESEDADPSTFVVRYFDHRLDLQQRYRFEEFMRTEHGIEILSTEKRFKRKPQPRQTAAARRGAL